MGLLCGYGVYVLVCASFNTVLAAMARRSGGVEGSLLADQSGSSTLANGQIRRFYCSFVGAETTIMILCFVVVIRQSSSPSPWPLSQSGRVLAPVVAFEADGGLPSEHEVSEMGSVRPGRTHSAAPTLNGSFASNCELEESIDMDDP